MAQARITGRILAFVESHEFGIVSTEEGFILQKNLDTVLGPDVAFVSKARLGAEPRTWSDVPPDLAVEVASPSNTRADLERKVRIYLETGCEPSGSSFLSDRK